MKHPTLTALSLLSILVLGLHACAASNKISKGDAVTAQAKAFPFPTTVKTLPNGLRVFVVEYDSPGLVAYYSVVRTGAATKSNRASRALPTSSST